MFFCKLSAGLAGVVFLASLSASAQIRPAGARPIFDFGTSLANFAVRPDVAPILGPTFLKTFRSLDSASARAAADFLSEHLPGDFHERIEAASFAADPLQGREESRRLARDLLAARREAAEDAAARVFIVAEETRGRFERQEIGEEFLFSEARRLSGAASLFGAEARRQAAVFEEFARGRRAVAHAEEYASHLAAWSRILQAPASAVRFEAAESRSEFESLEKPGAPRQAAMLALAPLLDESPIQIFIGGYADALSRRAAQRSAPLKYKHSSLEIETVLKNAFMNAFVDVARSSERSDQDRARRILERFESRLDQDQTYAGSARERVSELKVLLVRDRSVEGAVLRRDLAGWVRWRASISSTKQPWLSPGAPHFFGFEGPTMRPQID